MAAWHGRVTGQGVGVEARGWGWRHTGRRAWAIHELSLQIEPGERVLLLGPSGAGKSTLLRGLAGLLDPGAGEQRGELRVGGRPARMARDLTGLLFQDPESQVIMGRVGDDVAFGLENRCVPSADIRGRVDGALDAVGFPYERDRPTSALSGGEKQLLALAGTLALRPSLLLLDEPTANLDPIGARRLRGVLAAVLDRLRPTLIMVEHRVEESLALVNRVLVLGPQGELIADGSPGWIFDMHGDSLERAGVWVPGKRIAPPQRPATPQPVPQSLVLADQVSFRYPGAVRTALSPVDARVRSGEALAITGPNGSGKTTLGLLLGGLLRPTTGTLVAGEALARGHGREPIWRWPARALVTRIGSVFQDPEHQFLTGSVREELALGPLRAGISRLEARRRADALVDRLHLAHLAEANPFTLSIGEQRRLSVATALATAPAVLVLDEPTFGQDRRTWGEMLRLLAALRDDGRAICVASHDRDFVQALADRTLRLAAG